MLKEILDIFLDNIRISLKSLEKYSHIYKFESYALLNLFTTLNLLFKNKISEINEYLHKKF